jgi:hypothetical protein
VSGFVYFIACEPLGAVKIGYTGGNPYARMASLQTGCPSPLKMLAFVPASLDDERRLHDSFAPLGIQGEWFRYECKLVDLVNWMTSHGEVEGATREAFERALHDVLMQNGGWTPHCPIEWDEYNATGTWEPFRPLLWDAFGPWEE